MHEGIRRLEGGCSPAGAKESRPARDGGGARLRRSGSGRSAPAHSCCLLQGTQSVSTFCCQIEQGQGLEEDDPDPRPVLPDLALGRACVSVYCVCTVVCVCVCFPGLCVLALLLLDSPPWVASFLWASVFWELRQDV